MNKPLVLIVEDHPAMRETLANAFQREGMDTLTVDSGDEALALLHASSPDLVLLDVELAGAMSGFDVLLAIRQSASLASTLVVLHTYESSVATMAQAKAADLVLLKPVNVEELFRLINRLLNQGTGIVYKKDPSYNAVPIRA